MSFLMNLFCGRKPVKKKRLDPPPKRTDHQMPSASAKKLAPKVLEAMRNGEACIVQEGDNRTLIWGDLEAYSRAGWLCFLDKRTNTVYSISGGWGDWGEMGQVRETLERGVATTLLEAAACPIGQMDEEVKRIQAGAAPWDRAAKRASQVFDYGVEHPEAADRAAMALAELEVATRAV